MGDCAASMVLREMVDGDDGAVTGPDDLFPEVARFAPTRSFSHKVV